MGSNPSLKPYCATLNKIYVLRCPSFIMYKIEITHWRIFMMAYLIHLETYIKQCLETKASINASYHYSCVLGHWLDTGDVKTHSPASKHFPLKREGECKQIVRAACWVWYCRHEDRTMGSWRRKQLILPEDAGESWNILGVWVVRVTSRTGEEGHWRQCNYWESSWRGARRREHLLGRQAVPWVSDGGRERGQGMSAETDSWNRSHVMLTSAHCVPWSLPFSQPEPWEGLPRGTSSLRSKFMQQEVLWLTP